VAFRQALEIVHAYGTVLRRVPGVVEALPASLLPYPAPMIRDALELVARHVSAGDLEGRMWVLEDAYARLASFVPDEDAATALRSDEVLRSGNVEHRHDIEASVEIARRIREEQRALVRRFRKLRDD
jgi:hypothetical protein